jgi:hypothetical protein
VCSRIAEAGPEAFVESVGGLLVPVAEPEGMQDRYETSPSFGLRGGVAWDAVAAEMALTGAWLRRDVGDSPLDHPSSPRYRVLVGGRFGHDFGRARIFIRGAAGLDQLRATYLMAGALGEPLRELVVTSSDLGLDLGAGAQVDLGRLGGYTAHAGIQVSFAIAFRDRTTYELEPLLTLGLRR